MAHVSKAAKATIAANLSPVLKKYNVKATLAVRHGRTVVLNIRGGSVDFMGREWVNTSWFREHFTGEALAFLTEAMAALKSAGWHDRSDISSDYFDTAYYIDINIGTRGKPYQSALQAAA